MLEDLGHTVIRANSGRRALEMLETEPVVDVLMTDHAMPGMTRLELAEVALRKRPYFFQSAPSTNPRTATPASVAMGCSLSDFSTRGFTCLTASCACSP